MEMSEENMNIDDKVASCPDVKPNEASELALKSVEEMDTSATSVETDNKVVGQTTGVDKFMSPTFVAPKKAVVKRKPQAVVKRKSQADENTRGKEPALVTSQSETTTQGQTPHTVENKAEHKTEKQEKIDENQRKPSVPFSCPNWCTTCSEEYSLEILKNGVLKGKLDLTEKPFYIFGRLEGCDVLMEHPSISRYHAVIVYRGSESAEEKGSKIGEGFYVMDLGSTHGTVVNKIALQPHVYHRIRVGYVIKFGGSSRLHVLQGPEEDQDEEVDMKIIKQKSEIENIKQDEEPVDEDDGDNGVSWGMGEDAVEEELDLQKLLASRKPLELKDPKKTLRGFFEREGLELEYESDERGTGHSKVYVIRVKLPIEDSLGEELIAEGTSTKKKDAVVACAYEACRIIDAHGMLRNAIHESESSKRAKRLAENDYYDSDEDSFLDRTGAVESKRKKRLKKAGKSSKEVVETYETLKDTLETTLQEIRTLEKSLSDDRNAAERGGEEDDLDQFMSTVASRLDQKTRISMKHRLAMLKKEQRRAEKLLEIVKPVELPPLQVFAASPAKNKNKDDSGTAEEVATVEPIATNRVRVKPAKTDNEAEPAQAEINKAGESKRAKNPGISLMETISRINPELEESGKKEQHTKQKQKAKKKVYGAQMAPGSAPKFDAWVPPKGQTGDGKTHLNERFGY